MYGIDELNFKVETSFGVITFVESNMNFKTSNACNSFNFKIFNDLNNEVELDKFEERFFSVNHIFYQV